ILLLDTINNDEVQEFYIFDSIINNNPELKAIQESSLSLQHAIQMQKKMSYPMIGVGLEWMINKQIDMPKMESMNGKDMFGIMLKVSLPVYRKKYSSSITSIKYKNLSLEEDFQYKIERLRNEFLSLCNDMTIERKKIDLYHRQQNLLKENISIEQNTYSTKNNNIKDLLELEYKLFDYQIKILVSQTNLNKIVAKMEQLKGEDNTYILRK
ncbi:MAG: TolC family protein, partial [Bacteroidota bacterium]|nr:TolC family protein [Bacteroidota bacterium]